MLKNASPTEEDDEEETIRELEGTKSLVMHVKYLQTPKLFLNKLVRYHEIDYLLSAVISKLIFMSRYLCPSYTEFLKKELI